jgi:hypothetical protein
MTLVPKRAARPTAYIPTSLNAQKSRFVERFVSALSMLCDGEVPPNADMVDGWFTGTDVDSLQEWAINNAEAGWAQGIAVIDAATILAENPLEGVEGHEPSPFVKIDKRTPIERFQASQSAFTEELHKFWNERVVPVITSVSYLNDLDRASLIRMAEVESLAIVPDGPSTSVTFMVGDMCRVVRVPTKALNLVINDGGVPRAPTVGELRHFLDEQWRANADRKKAIQAQIAELDAELKSLE